MLKKLILFITVLTLSVGLWAETQTVSYLYPVYNTDGVATSGIKEWKTGEVEATVVTSTSSAVVTWNAGWYVVTGTGVTLFRGAVCKGAVHLILADGAKVTATGRGDNQTFENNYAGIEVSGAGNSLTIYGQAEQSGYLDAIGGYSSAGIGGGYQRSGSNITINGGIVVASSGTDEAFANGAAGIGGGCSGSGSNITINGGKVMARGARGGTGIGGGECGSGSNITINGGIVEVGGGENAAGIGGGDGRSGSNITINGGKVTANGAKDGTGIGGGTSGSGSNIFVNTDLIVKAGTKSSSTTVIENNGTDLAGSLKGKRYVVVESPFPTKYIDENGVEQTANVWEVMNADEQVTWGKEGKTIWYVVNGEDVTLSKGAICQGDVHLILADGAKLTATGIEGGLDNSTPAIKVSGEGNSFTVYGQTAQTGQLIADGGDYAAGIGGGYNTAGSNITINGGSITAIGKEGAAGIGGGGRKTNTDITVNGSNITINGGKVTATGGKNGAGIGGGAAGSGFNITITDGEIIATGGDFAAGIGGGGQGSCFDITISGGKITATGGLGNSGMISGIGRGYLGSIPNTKNIFAATNCIVKAGTSETLTDENIVEHNSETDITSSLNGKRYVEIETVWLVPYLDENGELKTVADPTIVTDASGIVYWNAGWYVVMGDVTLAQGANCSGAIHLILADGAKLTATGRVGDAWEMGFPGTPGIRVVGESTSFTVYAQSTDPTTMGQLIARGGWLAAGIGGDHGNASNITINGGTIVANGGDDGAGIGGGRLGSCTNIHINGGQVRASSIDFCASGIGGGCSEDFPMSGKDIYVSTNLIIKAGNNDPSTVIENDGGDLAGKLEGKRYVTIEMPAKGNLTVADFVVSNTSAIYDGTPKAVTVALKEGITGVGDITVKYNGIAEAPIAAGDYAVSIDVAEGDNYNATTDLTDDEWTFTIKYSDEWETFRDGLTIGRYGTACPRRTVTDIKGAKFFEVVEFSSNVKLREVTTLEAGVGYVFQATDNAIQVKYTGEIVDEPVPAVQGLQGTFTEIQDGEAGAPGNVLEGNYIVYNNKFYKCGESCGLSAYRAYLLNVPFKAAVSVAGLRTMEVFEEPTTSIRESGWYTVSDVLKFLRDGVVYILRGGKVYNLKGIRVR